MTEVCWAIPESWVRGETEHYYTYEHTHTLPAMLTCPQSKPCTSMHESSAGTHGTHAVAAALTHGPTVQQKAQSPLATCTALFLVFLARALRPLPPKMLQV